MTRLSSRGCYICILFCCAGRKNLMSWNANSKTTRTFGWCWGTRKSWPTTSMRRPTSLSSPHSSSPVDWPKCMPCDTVLSLLCAKQEASLTGNSLTKINSFEPISDQLCSCQMRVLSSLQKNNVSKFPKLHVDLNPVGETHSMLLNIKLWSNPELENFILGWWQCVRRGWWIPSIWGAQRILLHKSRRGSKSYNPTRDIMFLSLVQKM